MPTIAEIRSQYPQYEDMSDDDLARALHSKNYSDMDYGAFRQKIGMVPEFDPGVEGYNPETGEVERTVSKASSAAYGAADQASLGFGDELASFVGSWLSGEPREDVLREMRANKSRAQEANPGSYLAGQIGGGLAQGAIAGPASFTARMGGSTLGRAALGSRIDGAILGGAYGVGSGENAQERAASGLIGAGVGGVAGTAMPYIVKGASEVGRRLVSPFGISPERQAAATVLAREGVDTTAGQRTGSEALRYAESELGGRRAQDVVERQAAQFTDAAMRRAGGSGNATSDNLLAMQDRLSKGFEDIAARNNLKADAPFLRDMIDTLQEYGRVLPSEQKQILGNIATDIGERVRAGGGTLPGKDYQVIRSRLTTRAQNAKGSDNELAAAYRGLRDTLDKAMDRSVTINDKGQWQTLRKQWGNMKTLQKAATGGGQDAGLGIISPSQLSVAARSGKNRSNYAVGKDDFAELAKAGQALLKPLPNSGTAARNRAQNLGISLAPTILGSAGGAGYGATQGGYEGAMIGAAAGAALPRAAGALLMSPVGQGLLANQLLSGSASPATQQALTGILNSITIPRITERVR